MILLYLGGFMLSTAMQKSGAHRRLALGMVNTFGGAGDRGVVFGFMAAAAFLSMWISNTATSLMLLPIALATLENVELAAPQDRPVLLGIAYACNVGGIGTPIGTPPNLIFMQVYTDTHRHPARLCRLDDLGPAGGRHIRPADRTVGHPRRFPVAQHCRSRRGCLADRRRSGR